MGFEQEPDVHTETVCDLPLRVGHGNNIQAKFVLKVFGLPLNCAVENRRETSCAQTSGRDVLKKSLGMDAALSDSYVLRCRSKAGYLSCQAVIESTIFLTMAVKLSLRDNMPPQLWAWIQRINSLPLSPGVWQRGRARAAVCFSLAGFFLHPEAGGCCDPCHRSILPAPESCRRCLHELS